MPKVSGSQYQPIERWVLGTVCAGAVGTVVARIFADTYSAHWRLQAASAATCGLLYAGLTHTPPKKPVRPRPPDLKTPLGPTLGDDQVALWKKFKTTGDGKENAVLGWIARALTRPEEPLPTPEIRSAVQLKPYYYGQLVGGMGQRDSMTPDRRPVDVATKLGLVGEPSRRYWEGFFTEKNDRFILTYSEEAPEILNAVTDPSMAHAIWCECNPKGDRAIEALRGATKWQEGQYEEHGAEASDTFFNLSDDVIRKFLQYVHPLSVARLAKTCKRLHHGISGPRGQSLWATFCTRDFGWEEGKGSLKLYARLSQWRRVALVVRLDDTFLAALATVLDEKTKAWLLRMPMTRFTSDFLTWRSGLLPPISSTCGCKTATSPPKAFQPT